MQNILKFNVIYELKKILAILIYISNVNNKSIYGSKTKADFCNVSKQII